MFFTFTSGLLTARRVKIYANRDSDFAPAGETSIGLPMIQRFKPHLNEVMRVVKGAFIVYYPHMKICNIKQFITFIFLLLKINLFLKGNN